MADPISEIHLAIEPLLRPWFPADRWQIDTVPSPLSLGDFQRLMRGTAWMGIAWREFRIEQGAGRQLKGVHDLMLTIAVKNVSGIQQRLMGDRLGPGLYPALATAAGALHGRNLVDYGSLHVTRAGQAYAEGYGDLTVAIGVVELQCMTMHAPNLGEPAAAPDFTKLVSDWVLSPAIEGAPAATDTLQLPGASAP